MTVSLFKLLLMEFKSIIATYLPQRTGKKRVAILMFLWLTQQQSSPMVGWPFLN